MPIHVFKTNITKRLLKPTTSVFKEKKEVVKWSVDLEDKDRVLRFESTHNNPQIIIKDLKTLGIRCEELQ